MVASLLLAVSLASTSHATPTALHPARAAPSPRARKPVVPFIEDDFTRALALAKQRKLPVFIEGWAPW